VAVLQEAVGRGLLNPDEGSERMAAAFAAVHLDDLPPLTADLPTAPSPRVAPGWRPLAEMTLTQLRNSLGDATTGRLGPRAVVLAALVVVLVLIVAGMSLDLLLDGGGPGPGDFHH
jgi:hypothetical protein